MHHGLLFKGRSREPVEREIWPQKMVDVALTQGLRHRVR